MLGKLTLETNTYSQFAPIIKLMTNFNSFMNNGVAVGVSALIQ